MMNFPSENYDPTAKGPHPLEALVPYLPHRNGNSETDASEDGDEITRALSAAWEMELVLGEVQDGNPTPEQRVRIAGLRFELAMYAHGFDDKMATEDPEATETIWGIIEEAIHGPLIETLGITGEEALAGIDPICVDKKVLKRISPIDVYPGVRIPEYNRLLIASEERELEPREKIRMQMLAALGRFSDAIRELDTRM